MMLLLVLVYTIVYIMTQTRYYLFGSNRRYMWDVFTRIMSTLNAINCISFIIGVNGDYYDLNYIGSNTIVDGLYNFCTYLFVDFVFIILTNTYDTISILHHVVGGLGIYFIASQRQGLGLGIYFAWTEISTPLLNLSWLYHSKKIKAVKTFIAFYIAFFVSRILTIPSILNYINYNSKLINKLPIFYYMMVYGGSWCLIIINVIWLVLLTSKIKSIINTQVICDQK